MGQRQEDQQALLDGELDEAIDMTFQDPPKLTAYLVFVVGTAIIGSFLFGWNIGVLNNPEKIIRACPDGPSQGWLPDSMCLDDLQWGTVVGIFAIGGLLGGVSGGQICRAVGRIKTLLLTNLFFIIGSLLLSLSINITMLAIGRFVVGIGCGIATAAVPLYLSEIAPSNYRGAIGAMHQLACVFGILMSQVVGLFLSNVPGWRFLVGLSAGPSALQVLLLPFCVESPRYDIGKNMAEKARMALQRLRGSYIVDHEFAILLAAQRRESNADGNAPSKQLSILDIHRMPIYRKALIIAYVAQLAQQLSGINGVIQYSSAIFEGIFGDQALYVTVGVGVINLIVTIFSVVLLDRLGRRFLMLLSSFGMSITSTVIVVASVYLLDYLTVAGVVSFVALFAIGLGPIPWLIMPEIFPAAAIAPASSMGVLTNWLANFLISLIFPSLSRSLQAFTFLPFAIIQVVFGVFMYFLLPETKGKSVEEIADFLSQ